ncbi:MAG: helix-turn-helix transcriptional regulator, partial [Pseudomonadota bacterium]|nr:helix-turn-helix transcriptional regulator [Pseudomonadota bacterium]
WPVIKVGEGAIIGSFNTRVRALVDRFGSETLSDREHEIVQLILQGHSGKSMARILGVSPETVKVYRKHIHYKLNIHSQGELFSRLLASLIMTTSEPVGYPLMLLRQNPKKS